MDAKSFLEKSGIDPKPNLDQHFMFDKVMIRKIAALAKLGKKDVVFEIGAGIGTLTRELAKKSKTVVAVEIDRKFEDAATRMTRGLKNIEFVWGDALKEIERRNFDVLVSNTPYAICEALIHKLVHKKFRTAVLSVPKGFSEILLAEKGSKHYSKLSILSGAFFHVELKYAIPQDAFYPAPKTKSVVIKLTPLQDDDYKKSPAMYFARQIFLQKKKKLKNALREAIISAAKIKGKTVTKRQAKAIVKKLGQIAEKEFQDLSLSEMQKIIDTVEKAVF